MDQVPKVVNSICVFNVFSALFIIFKNFIVHLSLSKCIWTKLMLNFTVWLSKEVLLCSCPWPKYLRPLCFLSPGTIFAGVQLAIEATWDLLHWIYEEKDFNDSSSPIVYNKRKTIYKLRNTFWLYFFLCSPNPRIFQSIFYIFVVN
jgi:hypothetical protein